MGFFADAISRKSITSSLDLFRELYGGAASKSGQAVNTNTAVRVAAVFACLRVIGNGMAQVPLKLMRLSPDGKSRAPATDHPLYEILGLKPNPWQSSFEFRQTMSWHVELAGRFIAFKNAPAGSILELIPFEPSTVKITRRPDLSLKYEVTAPNGSAREFPEESIWHVRGPSWDSWSGLKIVEIARDAIGLAIALEESQAGLHKNGVQTTGAWSVEGKLSPSQYTELADWIKSWYAGSANAGKPLILDRAAKWNQQQMSGVDAQAIENRKEQIAEICRFFGVNPIMAGYTDKVSTHASAEQMFLSHVVHCLSPRWTALEQSMAVNLLTKKDREAGLYFKFIEEGMIRGAVKDTKDAIVGYVNGGIMTPNEGRGKLDMNPDADPASDELRIPVTTVQAPDPAADPSGDGGDPQPA